MTNKEMIKLLKDSADCMEKVYGGVPRGFVVEYLTGFQDYEPQWKPVLSGGEPTYAEHAPWAMITGKWIYRLSKWPLEKAPPVPCPTCGSIPGETK